MGTVSGLTVLLFASYVLALCGGSLILLWYRSLPKGFLWMGWYLVVAGLFQLAGYFMAVNGLSNVGMYNVATCIYYVLLFGVFWHLSSRNRYRRHILLWFTTGFAVLVYLSISAYKHETSPISAIILSDVVVSGAALYVFYTMLKHTRPLAPVRQGVFWLVAALFFYHTSSFAYWAINYYLKAIGETGLLRELMILNVLLIILYYSLVVVGIFVARREPDNRATLR